MRKVGYNKETRKIEKKKMDSRGGRAVGMCCCQRKEREKNEWSVLRDNYVLLPCCGQSWGRRVPYGVAQA
jgi:hypothetical protein